MVVHIFLPGAALTSVIAVAVDAFRASNLELTDAPAAGDLACVDVAEYPDGVELRIRNLELGPAQELALRIGESNRQSRFAVGTGGSRFQPRWTLYFQQPVSQSGIRRVGITTGVHAREHDADRTAPMAPIELVS